MALVLGGAASAEVAERVCELYRRLRPFGMAERPGRRTLKGMGRSRLLQRALDGLAVLPWLLALLGALFLTGELSPPSRGSAVSPAPPQVAPQPKPEHKDEVVFQPWEHVST